MVAMEQTSGTPEPENAGGHRDRRRSQLMEFAPAAVLYVVLLVGASQLTLDTTFKRVAFAAVPVAPVVLIVRGVMRRLASADAMGRMAAYRSMAVGFGAAMGCAMVMGFAGIAYSRSLAPEIGAWVVFGVGMAAWIVAGAFGERR